MYAGLTWTSPDPAACFEPHKRVQIEHYVIGFSVRSFPLDFAEAAFSVGWRPFSPISTHTQLSHVIASTGASVSYRRWCDQSLAWITNTATTSIPSYGTI